MKYKVRLIMEYIEIADSKEEAIESAKFKFDYLNNSSFCQMWDKVQCKELLQEDYQPQTSLNTFALPNYMYNNLESTRRSKDGTLMLSTDDWEEDKECQH